MGRGLHIYEVSRSHTPTHHRWHHSPGRVISSSQRFLPDNTQQSIDRHPCPRRIRTHNLSKHSAADLRLRSRGRWDRQVQSSFCFSATYDRDWCQLCFNQLYRTSSTEGQYLLICIRHIFSTNKTVYQGKPVKNYQPSPWLSCEVLQCSWAKSEYLFTPKTNSSSSMSVYLHITHKSLLYSPTIAGYFI